jgi:hypothetical protein
MSTEAEQRRTRSQARLTAEWVPIDEDVPLVPAAGEVAPRSHEATLARAMALVVVAVKADGMPREQAVEVLASKGLLTVLTPPEQDAIAADEIDERQRVQLVWRYEAAWTLLWVAGVVDELGPANKLCDLEQMVTVIRDESIEDLKSRATMRTVDELLDTFDLVTCYRHAVGRTLEERTAPPPACHPDVVAERFGAMDWLLIHTEAGWGEDTADA